MITNADADTLPREKHDLICNAYAELSPRPSKAHRICIFFPAEEQKLRLVWVRPYDHHAVKTLVAPQGLDTEFAAGPRVEPDDKDPSTYRDVVFFHADTYLFRTELAYNQSIGFAAVGRPMKSVRGSMMVTVSECSDVEDGVFQSDITPGDFLAALRHSSRAKLRTALLRQCVRTTVPLVVFQSVGSRRDRSQPRL